MTALQRLLTRIDNMSYSPEELQVVDSIREHLISLLPLEREQIETAYSRGMLDGSDPETKNSIMSGLRPAAEQSAWTPGWSYYERLYSGTI